jgi:hypothetical protein
MTYRELHDLEPTVEDIEREEPTEFDLDWDD